MERISGVITHLAVAEHQRRMVDAHRHIRALALESTYHINKSRIEMRRLAKITVRKHTTDTCMDKMSACGILASEFRNIVVGAGTERTGTECQAVMRIGNRI